MNEQNSVVLPTPQQIPQKKSTILLVFVLFAIIFLFLIILYFWQKFEYDKMVKDLNQQVVDLESQIEEKDKDLVVNTSTPSEKPTTPTKSMMEKTFTYEQFSINYPSEWKILEKDKVTDFPLKDRLSYADQKVFALEKQGVYLIGLISKETDGEVGGIFMDNADYNKYVEAREELSIQNKVFYLKKEYSSIDALAGDDLGPAMWSSISEFVPQKTTGTGGIVYDGYVDLIKRNGYEYIFFLTGEENGNLDEKATSELVKILESINW